MPCDAERSTTAVSRRCAAGSTSSTGDVRTQRARATGRDRLLPGARDRTGAADRDAAVRADRREARRRAARTRGGRASTARCRVPGLSARAARRRASSSKGRPFSTSSTARPSSIRARRARVDEWKNLDRDGGVSGDRPMRSLHPLDAIDLEVIKASLAGIVQEMQNSLFRTGYSTIVRESQDASCALMNARRRGRRAACGAAAAYRRLPGLLRRGDARLWRRHRARATPS